MQRRGCHKLVHKLISFHHSVTAFHTSHLVECLYIVRLYARIVNEERHRLSSMCTQFARCGVVGKHGNSHRLVPIFHCLINRPTTRLSRFSIVNCFNLKSPHALPRHWLRYADRQSHPSEVLPMQQQPCFHNLYHKVLLPLAR